MRRFAVRKITQTTPYLRAEIELLDTLPAPATKEFEAAFRNLRESAAKLLELTPDVPEQARAIVLGMESAEELTDFLAPNLNLDVPQKQALLEEKDVEKRLHAVQASISSQLEIAQASARLAAMNIGGEDFALETGMEPTEETLLMPKQQMIFAARAAGIMPLGFIASVAGFGDWEAFGRMVRRSRQFGFMGASCIHPGQVAIVNREYSPSADEVAYASRIVEENAKHEAAGRASWSLDGKMIDVPVVVRAQRLLARHAAIQAREARKSP